MTKEVETHSTLPLLRSLEIVCQSHCGRQNLLLRSAMLPLKQSLLLLVALSTCYGSLPSTTEYGAPEYLPAPPGETPTCANNGETYCENIDTYPLNHIQQLIDKKTYIYDTFFSKEDEEQFSQSYEGTICKTRVKIATPEAAVNTQGIWMYIVNQGANSSYLQNVTVAKCESPDSNCCEGIITLSNRYNGTCKQQYAEIIFLALSNDGKDLYPDKFTFPHCCLCMFIKK